MREHAPAPAITTLRAWQRAGKLEIFETDRPDTPPAATGWPGAKPAPPEQNAWGGKRRPAPKKNLPAAAMFGRVSAVVFPSRDTHKLNMAELNDVTHLLRHLTLGRSIFVTRNAASFLDQGKRERLLSVFQILVMTPEEAVAHLAKAEGWPV